MLSIKCTDHTLEMHACTVPSPYTSIYMHTIYIHILAHTYLHKLQRTETPKAFLKCLCIIVLTTSFYYMTDDRLFNPTFETSSPTVSQIRFLSQDTMQWHCSIEIKTMQPFQIHLWCLSCI